MIEFLKQKRIVIIIALLVIILVGWKIYDKSNFESTEESQVIDSNIQEDKTEKNEEIIIVHVTGEVKKPGVVRVKEGSRIEDIIKEAGGLTEKADISNINLAYIVEDGTKIRIPSTDDEEKKEYITQDIGEGIIMQEENTNINNIININTANETELEGLPGIGSSIAVRIVEYRNKNGKFKNKEDIKNVTGIGDSKFERIKDLIKVK